MTARQLLARLILSSIALVGTATFPMADAKALSYEDTTAIDWFTPGSFTAARQEAEQQQRLLMIKGIAFGVDEAGAKCATKGCW